jgi:hypothetical protein
MLKPPFRLMIVARSQMGKTTLLIKLLLYYWMKMFDHVFIFCSTYSLDDKWSAIDAYRASGKVRVWGNVKEKTVRKVWAECSRLLVKDPKKQFLVLFDDCGGQEGFKVDKPEGIINQLVTRGNHSNITTIWVVQKVTQASTTMRANAEGVITFYQQSESELRYLWNEFGVGSFNQFKTMLRNATSEPYHSFYVNRQGPGAPDYYHNFRYIQVEATQ